MAYHKLSFKIHALMQVLAAGLFIFTTMSCLYFSLDQPILWVVGISSLASSAFLVFCVPHSMSASPKRIVCGYALSMVIGLLTHMALETVCRHCELGNSSIQSIMIAASLALSITLLLMVVLRVAHPPAAGVVLVIVIQHHIVLNILVLLTAALALAFVRLLFGRYLVDLIKRPTGIHK